VTPLHSSLAVGFGPTEIVLVVGVLVLVFGARKIPLLARGLGAGIRNFKGELGKPKDEIEDDSEEAPQ